MLKNKNIGFKRQSPQVTHVTKSDKTEFPCNQCDHELESEGLLIAHMNSHEVERKCDQCGTVFWTESLLMDHVENNHKDFVKSSPKQYNCNDCAFQGENGIELKRHIKRTKHTPSDTQETCYTCKKVFTSYFKLMNHRKSEHPSNRTCRFFLDGECIFDADDCWYRHHEKQKQEESQPAQSFACNLCDAIFKHKYELMKHKKEKHISKVSKFRAFLQGNCSLNEKSCWFVHSSGQDENEEMVT